MTADTLAAGEVMEVITKELADALWAAAEKAKAARAEAMPTEQDAINVMWSAYHRLQELGWRDAIYCPKDGTTFRAIEPGSTGIHESAYQGEWPNGSWVIYEAGDAWPSYPCLFRPLNDQQRGKP